MKYFITGGTGFIGRRLIEKILSIGGEITLLVRDTSDLKDIEGKRDVKIIKGSLFDVASIKQAMKETDAVFHLAGYAKNWSRDNSVYEKVNVQGSLNVAAAAVEAKVKKMVHVSSIVAFGPTDKTEHNENTQTGEIVRFTEYERTKALAEDELIRFAGKHKELDIIIVNPSRVYGPGIINEANSLTLMIRNYLKFREYLLLGLGNNIANYVFVDDVVQGLLQAADRGKSGEKYILGGETISLRGFFRKLRIVSGKRAMPIVVPKPVAMTIGFCGELAAKLFGIYPFITRPWIRHFCADWNYGSAKAVAELGYTPTALDDGLKITVNWLKQKRQA
jgi:nucleoside-diphosphate-sugar epimerase